MENEVIAKLKSDKEFLWINPNFYKRAIYGEVSSKEINEANNLLLKFAPFLKSVFKELESTDGIIESPLMTLNKFGIKNLYLKEDNLLPIAGSVKARGGIFEILKYAETLAANANLIDVEKDYSQFDSDVFRKFFSEYKIQVGSTGNLGISIGLISAKLGFNAIVHMSKDAKDWKKKLLRENGVNVTQYDSNYSEAVKNGRMLSDEDEKSYFVDDEKSINLFLGYSTAALRLKEQLKEKHISVDDKHPLFVYIPCGVGGAPSGILHGLKTVFGENVYVFFVEPVRSASVLLGMSTGLNSKISVHDIGMDGKTEADGLAVGRASELCCESSQNTLSGIFTINENSIFELMKELYKKESVFVEPSAASSMIFTKFLDDDEFIKFINKEEISPENITLIAWSTGGMLVPESEREKLLKK
ncbi:MAG: D-serine ammonia-lyase [Ezakiella sp.]